MKVPGRWRTMTVLSTRGIGLLAKIGQECAPRMYVAIGNRAPGRDPSWGGSCASSTSDRLMHEGDTLAPGYGVSMLRAVFVLLSSVGKREMLEPRDPPLRGDRAVAPVRPRPRKSVGHTHWSIAGCRGLKNSVYSFAAFGAATFPASRVPGMGKCQSG